MGAATDVAAGGEKGPRPKSGTAIREAQSVKNKHLKNKDGRSGRKSGKNRAVGMQEREQFKKEKVKRVKAVKRSSKIRPEVPMKLTTRRAGLESSVGWQQTQPRPVHSPV